MPAGTRERLTGHLGVGSVVFMVIAAAAPLTVIGGNVPLSVGLGNGAGAPIGFVIAAAVLLLFSVGFVTMTPHVREAGAFFSYVTEGLGRRAGTGAAVVALLAYTAIQLGVYGYTGWAFNDTVVFYGGPELPWPVYSLVLLAVVAVLGYRHIELSAKVLGVALVLEIGIVVLLDLLIFGSGGADGLNATSFTPAAITSGSIGVPVLFALTGFIGFESTAVFRDEARDPERTIPRATYLAVLIIGGFYAVSCWALILAARHRRRRRGGERDARRRGQLAARHRRRAPRRDRPRRRQRPAAQQPVRVRAVVPQRRRPLPVRARPQGPAARPARSGARHARLPGLLVRRADAHRPGRCCCCSPPSAWTRSSASSARWPAWPRSAWCCSC